MKEINYIIRITSTKYLHQYKKKLIKDNKEWKSATTIHYDRIGKAIPNMKIILPLKPLWLPILYLTHQEKNNLRCT